MTIYAHPEDYGLRIFGTLSEPDLSWEFHFICVWEDLETHRLYYGEDSGCSCPAPFEGYFSRDDLTPIDNYPISLDRFARSCERTRPRGDAWSPNIGRWLTDKAVCISDVRNHLDKWFPV